MAARSNATAEITRFWLQTRHGCLVDEAVPVKIKPRGTSDIDLVAIRPDMKLLPFPDKTTVGPRLIVETKDEHDFNGDGREFGKSLCKDMEYMGNLIYIPPDTPPVKFTMLRQEHFEKAHQFFGTDDFDRVLVVHAIAPQVVKDLAKPLMERRIHIVTIRVVVSDLQSWYLDHPDKAGLRHTLMGDLWHLLIGYCGYRNPG